jgi:uncharacterized protein (UPF0147 family)
MEALSERFEVRLSAKTLYLLRQEAQQRKVPVGQLVRQAIEKMLQEDRELKLRSAEALFRVECPVSDWPQMKKEIEESRLKATGR